MRWGRGCRVVRCWCLHGIGKASHPPSPLGIGPRFIRQPSRYRTRGSRSEYFSCALKVGRLTVPLLQCTRTVTLRLAYLPSTFHRWGIVCVKPVSAHRTASTRMRNPDARMPSITEQRTPQCTRKQTHSTKQTTLPHSPSMRRAPAELFRRTCL